jgi:predicted RNA-binding Zn-ribbon protein involved in translation (DUF1610 family)
MTTAADTAPHARFPCRQCGADVEFAPGTDKVKCPYCSAENGVEAQGAVEELDLIATLDGLEQAAPHAEARTIKCQACAAEVTAPPHVTSFSCCFCGTNIVSQVECASRLVPNGVLPFEIPREKAVESFRRWVSSRWFAPNRLKSQSLIDHQLAGVYMPAWTFDTAAQTSYTGLRGDAYYVTVGSGKNRRRERRIRWTHASGRVRNDFDDVLVIASHSLPEKLVKGLEPWDLKAVRPYADKWLAGFRAETYQIDLKGGWVAAQDLMEVVIVETIRADIGGDEQQVLTKQVRYSGMTFKHLLLPVWVSAYRFRGKLYRFVINARTGEVQGERPYSAVKITLAVIAGLIVAGLVAFFVTR